MAIDMKQIELGENLTTEFKREYTEEIKKTIIAFAETAIRNMIKETEKYEDVRSLNQDLTFKEAKKFFDRENVPFGVNQHKTLHLQTTDGVYTNLGLLLSDQSVHNILPASFYRSVWHRYSENHA